MSIELFVTSGVTSINLAIFQTKFSFVFGIFLNTPSSLFSVISGISGVTDTWRPSFIVAIRTNAALDPRPFGST
jgi:hypothetical protein